MKNKTFKVITLFLATAFLTLPIGNVTKTTIPFPQTKLIEIGLNK